MIVIGAYMEEAVGRLGTLNAPGLGNADGRDWGNWVRKRGSDTSSSRAVLVLFPGLFQPSLAAWKDVKEGTVEPVTAAPSLPGTLPRGVGSVPEKNIG